MKRILIITLALACAPALPAAEADPAAALAHTSRWLVFTAGAVFAWLLFAPLRPKP